MKKSETAELVAHYETLLQSNREIRNGSRANLFVKTGIYVFEDEDVEKLVEVIKKLQRTITNMREV